MSGDKIGFPNDTHRTVIIGPTGSGKTVFGIWLLSTRRTLDWMTYPVIIFDFKGDILIEEIEPQEWPITRAPPRKPGLYVVRPHPHETEEVEKFLWQVWANGETGLYFDEGYMVAKSKALNSILTQGRSKRIPVIILAQRPVWLPRFAFSEAQFFAVFNLIDQRDRDTVRSFVNTDMNTIRLPYHCLWYDVAGNAGSGASITFQPVPKPAAIAQAFRLAKRPVEKRRL